MECLTRSFHQISVEWAILYYVIIYLYIYIFIFLLRLLVLIQQMFDATILLVVPRAHLHFDLRQSLRDFRKSCHVPNKLLWNPLFLGKEGPNYLLTFLTEFLHLAFVKHFLEGCIFWVNLPKPWHSLQGIH